MVTESKRAGKVYFQKWPLRRKKRKKKIIESQNSLPWKGSLKII